MSKSSGPRNNDDDRLRKPPNPKSKVQPRIQLLRLQVELPMTDCHGNTQLVCDVDIIHANNLSKSTSWLCDPDEEFVFWLSQSGYHSVVIYKDECYALMAVSNKTEKVEGGLNGSRGYRKKVAKILGVQKTNFEPETEEWIKDSISKFLIPVFDLG